MTKKAKDKCARLKSRVRRASEIENCSISKLFEFAGVQANISDKEVKEASQAYALAAGTHGRVNPDVWFRTYVNGVRKSSTRRARVKAFPHKGKRGLAHVGA